MTKDPRRRGDVSSIIETLLPGAHLKKPAGSPKEAPWSRPFSSQPHSATPLLLPAQTRRTDKNRHRPTGRRGARRAVPQTPAVRPRGPGPRSAQHWGIPGLSGSSGGGGRLRLRPLPGGRINGLARSAGARRLHFMGSRADPAIYRLERYPTIDHDFQTHDILRRPAAVPRAARRALNWEACSLA